MATHGVGGPVRADSDGDRSTGSTGRGGWIEVRSDEANGRPLSYEERLARDVDAQIDRLELDESRKAFVRSRWWGHVLWMERGATQSRRLHYALRLTSILGSVAIPALVALDVGQDADENRRWVTFWLGLLVAAATSLEAFFRYGERWRHYRHKVELLKGEGWAFFQLIGPIYAESRSHADAFPVFATRVEDAIRNEVDVYIGEVVRESGGEGKASGTVSTRSGEAPAPSSPGE